jgi:hypothetical protein
MKTVALFLSLFLCTALLAGCATGTATSGTQVAAERLGSIVPGRTTKAELLASFGKTTGVVFDSGYETWLYQAPAGGGRFAEFVVLIDPAGVVAKTRQRAPATP